jgi:hypothetical protein
MHEKHERKKFDMIEKTRYDLVFPVNSNQTNVHCDSVPSGRGFGKEKIEEFWISILSFTHLSPILFFTQ